MAAKTRPSAASAHLGFEIKLWLTADKFRNNMDAAEYKHVVLGLTFLGYISDSFDEHHAKLVAGEGEGDFAKADPEDTGTARRRSARCPVRRGRIPQDFRSAEDQYLAANAFRMPQEARWAQRQSRAEQPSIGKHVVDAMVVEARAMIKHGLKVQSERSSP